VALALSEGGTAGSSGEQPLSAGMPVAVSRANIKASLARDFIIVPAGSQIETRLYPCKF